MGVDKASLLLLSESMLERAVRVARAVCSRVLIVGREAPVAWKDDKTQFIPDRSEPFAGPIAGIITALEHAKGEVLVIACDMPLLSPNLLTDLCAAHAGQDAVATLAATTDSEGVPFAEPLLAVYTPRVGPTLRHWMTTGRRSLQPLRQHTGVATWEVPADMRYQLLNVNDEQTLREARRRLAGATGE
jgi:molybdopterin-guanine dinucleotide biosynthesis protein A